MRPLGEGYSVSPFKNNGTLLVLNYTLDPTHPALSHQTEVVEALAGEFQKVVVLTGSVNWDQNPSNVTMVSSNWKSGQNLRNVIRFYVKFFKLLLQERYTSVFSHMTLIQSFLIAPLLRVIKIPHYLWYAHAQDSFLLQFVNRFATGIITSTEGSCPIKGKKVVCIGQSINENNFTRETPPIPPLINFIHVGRADPSKNLEHIIVSVKKAKLGQPNIRLTLVGDPSNEGSRESYDDLRIKFRDDVVQGWLNFQEAVTRENIPSLLNQNDIFVHAFQGSLDKVLIEATLALIPVATVNHEYHRDFDSWGANPSDLSQELSGILLLDPIALSKELYKRREIAIMKHSMKQWVVKLSATLRQK
jgi:glycosyltransferase involved in cell wall biosynthesis